MREVRFVSNVQIRAKGNDTIQGYAAVFNNVIDLGPFTEEVKPGAFARAIRTGQDVRCLFNHDSNELLGRTGNRTLRLLEDSTGLDFECKLPSSQRARDVYALVERRDLSGCSFGFRVPKGGDKWVERAGKSLRQLLDVDLQDVGPVTFPAYPETAVAVRTLWPDGIPATVNGHSAGAPLLTRYYSLPAASPAVDPALWTEKARLRLRLMKMQDF